MAARPGSAEGPMRKSSCRVHPRRVSGPAHALCEKTVQSRSTAESPELRFITSPAGPGEKEMPEAQDGGRQRQDGTTKEHARRSEDLNPGSPVQLACVCATPLVRYSRRPRCVQQPHNPQHGLIRISEPTEGIWSRSKDGRVTYKVL